MPLEEDFTPNAPVKSFPIGPRRIGPGEPCFIIAEVAQSHDGSLGIAHSFIDAAADAGADAIKFQTHIAAAESTVDEPFRVPFSYVDRSRYDYWKRMEFSADQWAGLLDHARRRGILFLSSVFSIEAVDLLERIGVPAWKLGAGEFTNFELLAAILPSRLPILLSTGMSTWEEIAAVDRFIKAREVPFALLQCTSKYPAPLKDVGLNVIREFARRFRVPAGLSDHSGVVYPALAAMAQAANIIEVHVTFHRGMYGPDVPASIRFEDLRLLADARDAFHEMMSRPVDKDRNAAELEPMRSIFRKSLALKMDRPKGTRLTREMLTLKKPGTGIPAADIERCIGRVLAADVPASRLLAWPDLE
jgi:N-acetylneuraminate synthase